MTLRTPARLHFVISILVLLVVASCHMNRRDSDTQSKSSDDEISWDAYVNQFLDSYFAAHPDVAVRSGRHEFDGKLPDWSSEGIRKEIQRLRTEKARVSKFEDSGLEQRQEFERNYVMAVIDADLFWLESAEWPYRNPQFYADAVDPDVYVSRPYAPIDQRLRAYTSYAKAIPTALEQIRKNLRTPLPKTYVQIGRTTFGGLVSFYEKDVPAIFTSVKDEQLQKDFREANSAAIKAMRELDAWFQSQQATATDNFAIGAGKFSEMLRKTEGVEVRLDELEGVGRRDLERNQAALREACASYAPGQTLAECVNKAEAHKPTGGAVEMARKQLTDLKAFLVEKKIVTIPGTEEALVAEAPAYQRFDFAYINIPDHTRRIFLPPTTLRRPIILVQQEDISSPAETSQSLRGPAGTSFNTFMRTAPSRSWAGVCWLCLCRRLGSLHGRNDVGSRFETVIETHIGQLLNAMLQRPLSRLLACTAR